MGTVAMPKEQLPVIDFTKPDLKPGSNSWVSTCNRVRQALEDYGCFVAVYNKVSSELHETVVSQIGKLFDLPLDVKKQNVGEKPNTGYVGHVSEVPLHEALGIDHVTHLEKTQSFTKLMYPDGNDHFCENIHLFSTIVAGLDELVIRMVLESYGVGKYCDSLVASSTYLLKFLKYRAPQSNETTTGLPPHSDKSLTTIIHQNHAKGLEIETKDGSQWIAFEPSLTSFLVLAGDAFLAWSNGRIHSAKHRVIIGHGEKARYSFVQFNFNSGVIETPQELVDDEHPLQFKPFDHKGLLDFFVTEKGRKAKSMIHAYCGV